MSNAKQRMHVIVRGRVQGVFFRAWTQGVAKSLGLTGWVRNLADGGVELEAEGNVQALEDLLQRCKEGPPAARVDDLQCDWSSAEGNFQGFEVIR